MKILLLGFAAIGVGLMSSGNPDNPGCGSLRLFSSLSEYRMVCGEEYTGNNKIVVSKFDELKIWKELKEWQNENP